MSNNGDNKPRVELALHVYSDNTWALCDFMGRPFAKGDLGILWTARKTIKKYAQKQLAKQKEEESMADKRQEQAKRHEKAITDFLGGFRPEQSAGGSSVPDVVAPRFVVEAKTRDPLPQWLDEAITQAERHSLEHKSKIPIVILHEKRHPFEQDVVCIRMQEFQRFLVQLRREGVG